MQKSISLLRDQLHGISALGASPSALLGAVRIPCYGDQLPLSHLASFSNAGRLVTIQLFDQALATEVAVTLDDAGFHSYVRAKGIVTVNLPQPSGDTREEMKARIRRLGEEAKVAVRNVRKLYKQGLPRGQKFGLDQIQKLTDAALQAIDDIIVEKSGYVDK